MILAIESSCDETAVAVFDSSLRAELVASQIEVHRPYDGVVPEIAAREHLRVLPGLVEQILTEQGIAKEDLSLIAVTRGPGLKGCLLVGSMFAQSFAAALGVPCVGINHLEGHVFAPLLDCPELGFPFLAVLVSGGHSEIVKVDGIGSYEVLTKTIDDAAGEAFDKSASMIGLAYPGGPTLARLADSVDSSEYQLPLVMRGKPEMSFSGLKTAVRVLVQKQAQPEASQEDDIRTEFGYISGKQQIKIAHSVQRAINGSLMLKIRKAVESTGITDIALTGGVAANKDLRNEISRLAGVKLFVPEFKHCTDNAAMIAHVAHLRRDAGLLAGSASDLWQVKSRWPLSEIQ